MHKYTLPSAEIRQSIFFDIAHFGLRLAAGAIFVAFGAIKFDPGFDTYLHQMNLPADLRPLFALEEFVPGIFLIAGVLSRISASVLAAVMLGVIFYIDKASQFSGPSGAEYPILLLAVCIVTAITGPGRISIAHLAKKIPRFLH